MSQTELCALSEENLAFYREHGYLHVRDAVREETLSLSQTVLERWEVDLRGW